MPDNIKLESKNVAAYVVLFVFSAFLLMVEVFYARTARIAFGYEYQLLVISLAFAGIGIGGVPAYFIFRKQKIHFFPVVTTIFGLLALSTAMPLLAVLDIGTAEYAIENLGQRTSSIGVSASTMAWFCLAVFLVYLLGGLVIAAFLEKFSERTSSMYAVNLAGSALGAFAIVPLLDMLGNQTTLLFIFCVSLVPFSIAVMQCGLKKPNKIIVFTFMLLCIVGMIYASPHLRVGGLIPNEPYTSSNSFSDVFVSRMEKTGAAKGLSPVYQERVDDAVESFNIVYDRKLKTNAITYETLTDTEFLKYDTFYFPFLVAKKPNVLLLGAGGGTDIVRALLADSSSVTAVEANSLIIDIARDKLRSKAFDDPRVQLVIEEGRNYVSRTNRTYDLIYLANTGRFGIMGVNARYYADNFLHTREAYRSYFDRLTDSGILAIGNRDMFVKAAVGIGISALDERALSAEDSIAYIEGRGYSLILIKPSGFTGDEKILINAQAEQLHFRASFPSKPFIEAGISTGVSDDNPFLHDIDTIHRVFSPNNQTGINYEQSQLHGVPSIETNSLGNDDGFLTLRFLVGIFVFGSVIWLGLQFILQFIPEVRASRERLAITRLALLFSLLGISSISVQAFFLQRSFLIVGHPAYSIAVVLASILVFSGVGSMMSGLVSQKYRHVTAIAAAISISLLLGTYRFFMQPLFLDNLSLALTIRIPVFIALIAVQSLLAGTLFPLSLSRTKTISGELIPWMWAVNGAAVVLGGAAAALISYFFGFGSLLLAAAVCYILAAAFFPRLRVISS